MSITREQMNENLTFILGHPTDTADISQKLNEIRNGFDDHLRQENSLTSQVKTLQETNEKLVKQNMELFQQIGVKEDVQEETPDDQKDEDILKSLVNPKTGKFKLA